MEEIKGGTLSGFLPSMTGFAVHYPGYPSSISRAIETLGGTEAILHAHSSPSNKLELHFRPEDPYSHPAFGERRPCNSFLLRIYKSKRGNHKIGDTSGTMIRCSSADATQYGSGKVIRESESESVNISEEEGPCKSKEDQKCLYGDIIAQIPEAYYFEGMTDYQHVVAVHADVARRKKRNWTELEEASLGRGNLMDGDQEDVMIIVPPLFSLKDEPENLVLKTPSSLSTRKTQGAMPSNCEIEVEQVLGIDFNIEEVPKTVNWEEYIARGSEQWQTQTLVSKLFDERAIWPKESLAERLVDRGLTFRHVTIRRILSRIAYYFSNGPFLSFWIRKGYDPRKDPESRIYQVIDFRVPQQLRSYCETKGAEDLKQRREDICAFRVFPSKFQMRFQLFELMDDFIQEEIRKPATETTCSFGTGWFSQRVLDCIKLRARLRFLSAFPTAGAESLLKAASDRFHRLIRNPNKKLDVAEGETNAEAMNVDEKEEREDAEDEEEEEYAEDENGEDAFDAYEALAMDGEEGEIYLQSHSYRRVDMKRDNVSRTHLQELLASFPSTEEGGDKTQDAETSGEEYQIYEEDSEDNSEDYEEDS